MNNWLAAVFNIIADKDHLIPSCQSTSIMNCIRSTDRDLLIGPGGHIGIMAASNVHKRLWPHMDTWLSVRSSEDVRAADQGQHSLHYLCQVVVL